MIQRETASKALLNTDVASLAKYKQERNQVRKLEQIAVELSNVKQLLKCVSERMEALEKEYNGKTITN